MTGGETSVMMIARWSIDARFGHKQDVIASLSTWLQDIGSVIGWTDDKVRIITGSVGAPESTIELEVQLSGLDELDASWKKLGASGAHKDWSKEIEPHVVSGSPKWTVYRVI